ncbi:unnamed protein product [Rodentolepis nana]|uniref:Uncharacterized protein n=1 Tax=Rodentolepis nana TaxID=102285 RepID=A0A0R3TNB0_RODNA|nr:unnamed protein product [Rodentolepis nana]
MHDSRLNQSHKRSRYSSSATRKSTSQKHPGHNVRSQSSSTPPSVVVPSSGRHQRQSFSPESRSRDVVSLDAGLGKKKSDIPFTVSSSPKLDLQLESRVTADNLKSVPEVEEMVPSTSTVKPFSHPDEAFEPIQATPSNTQLAIESETAQTEIQEPKDLLRPNRPTVRSGLYIQAIGPNRSLLVQRIPAKGPNPQLRKGHNPALVKGPNPALLIKNR